jgi:hypothetical protein
VNGYATMMEELWFRAKISKCSKWVEYEHGISTMKMTKKVEGSIGCEGV